MTLSEIIEKLEQATEGSGELERKFASVGAPFAYIVERRVKKGWAI